MNILISIMLLSFCQTCKEPDQTPVEQFDINRYMGLWYEIARFDNSFEKGMNNVTAQYTLKPNGKVEVLNRGYKDGKLKQVTGKAKIGKLSTQGFLKVSFFFNLYSPYRVVMLADNYSYALVTSGRKYLWILSRTPQMDEADLEKVITEAKRRGFDTDKLLFS